LLLDATDLTDISRRSFICVLLYKNGFLLGFALGLLSCLSLFLALLTFLFRIFIAWVIINLLIKLYAVIEDIFIYCDNLFNGLVAVPLLLTRVVNNEPLLISEQPRGAPQTLSVVVGVDVLLIWGSLLALS
jgi:hypothetical protein